MEEENKEDITPETNEGEVAEEKKPDFKAKADAFYGKLKASEEKVKALEERLKAKEEVKADSLGDIEKIAQVTAALSGLDNVEQERLIAEAKFKGVSLSEAKKDDNFLLWKKAYNQKVEEEKQNLTPSTKQEAIEGEKSLDEMNLDEKEEHFKKLGLIKSPKSYEKKWNKQ